MSDTFIEVGTDPGDLDDSLDPCLSAGIGGFIVPENIEIVEICQDPNDLSIIFLRVSIQGIFSYTPDLNISYLDASGKLQTKNANHKVIHNYKDAAESPNSFPISTMCGAKTVMLAYEVGTLIDGYSSIVELTFNLKFNGEFISDEFDHDFNHLPIFQSANPSTSIIFTKGLNPQPHALFFDAETGQLKLQFSNIGNTTCICNINCVDISIAGEDLFPCGDELQEVTINTNSIFTSPTDVFIEISDSNGNTSNLSYFIVLGTTPLAPNAIKKSNPTRIEVNTFMITSNHENYKTDKTQYQLWRYENNTGNVKLVRDWTFNKFKSFIDTTVRPGNTYGYAVRMRADFNSLSEFSSWSTPVKIAGPRNRNTILFMLDDVGAEMLYTYKEVLPITGVHLDNSPISGIFPKTPIIDSLATNGVRFTNYRTMPYGSATRAGIMGGQYPFRNGVGTEIEENTTSYDLSEWGITGFNNSDKSQQALATLIQNVGMSTCMIGKWHLALETGDQAYGDVNNPGTPAQEEGFQGSGWYHTVSHGGFNEVYTTFTSLDLQVDGGSEYDYSVWYLNDSMTGNNQVIETAYLASGEVHTGVFAPTEAQKDAAYVTTVQLNQAKSWIDARVTDENFFLYVPLNTPRLPLTGFPPEHLVNSQTAINYKDSSIAFNTIARLEAFDTKLGELLTGIDPKILSKTNIIIAGDGGTTESYWNSLETYVFSKDIGTGMSQLVSSGNKFKNTVFEMGVRSPLIVSGPDVSEPGRDWPYLVDSVDLYPTIAEMAGVNYSNYVPSDYTVDGTSFLGALTSGTNTTGNRNYSLVEYYTFNGSVTGASDHNRGYTEWVEGSVSTGGSYNYSGFFKLVRLGTGLGTADLLYHLRDESLNNVDPFELTAKDISASSDYYDIYVRLTGNLNSITTL